MHGGKLYYISSLLPFAAQNGTPDAGKTLCVLSLHLKNDEKLCF